MNALLPILAGLGSVMQERRQQEKIEKDKNIEKERQMRAAFADDMMNARNNRMTPQQFTEIARYKYGAKADEWIKGMKDGSFATVFARTPEELEKDAYDKQMRDLNMQNTKLGIQLKDLDIANTKNKPVEEARNAVLDILSKASTGTANRMVEGGIPSTPLEAFTKLYTPQGNELGKMPAVASAPNNMQSATLPNGQGYVTKDDEYRQGMLQNATNRVDAAADKNYDKDRVDLIKRTTKNVMDIMKSNVDINSKLEQTYNARKFLWDNMNADLGVEQSPMPNDFMAGTMSERDVQYFNRILANDQYSRTQDELQRAWNYANKGIEYIPSPEPVQQTATAIPSKPRGELLPAPVNMNKARGTATIVVNPPAQTSSSKVSPALSALIDKVNRDAADRKARQDRAEQRTINKTATTAANSKIAKDKKDREKRTVYGGIYIPPEKQKALDYKLTPAEAKKAKRMGYTDTEIAFEPLNVLKGMDPASSDADIKKYAPGFIERRKHPAKKTPKKKSFVQNMFSFPTRQKPKETPKKTAKPMAKKPVANKTAPKKPTIKKNMTAEERLLNSLR